MAKSFPLLPVWSQIVWTAALFAVMGAHLRHAWGMRGQARWWHGSHVAMTAGMIVMYFPPSMTSDWFMAVKQPCLAVFSTAAVALVITTLTVWARERSLNLLWLLAAFDMTGMAYMWLPHGFRPVALSWMITGYWAIGTMAWLAGVWARPAYRTAVVAEPQTRAVLTGVPGAAGGASAGGPAAEPAIAANGKASLQLSPHGALGTRMTLGIMTASMAYMLLVML